MFELESITPRVMEILKYLNMSISEFADEMDVHKRFVQDWVSGKRAIPMKRLFHFLQIHSEFSLQWVIYGEGEMLEKSNEIKSAYNDCLLKNKEQENLIAVYLRTMESMNAYSELQKEKIERLEAMLKGGNEALDINT